MVCFKDWIIRKHKKYAFLHNTLKLGSDLEFPKQNLRFAKKEDSLKPPTWEESWTRHTPIIRSGVSVVSLSCPRQPLTDTPLQKPARIHVRNATAACTQLSWRCTSTRVNGQSVQDSVNNGTCITTIVIKICNTSRDHYGTIKKILHSVFKMA